MVNMQDLASCMTDLSCYTVASQLAAGEKFTATADHSRSDEFGAREHVRPPASRRADRPPTLAVAHASQSQSCPRYENWRTAG